MVRSGEGVGGDGKKVGGGVGGWVGGMGGGNGRIQEQVTLENRNHPERVDVITL